MRKVAVLAMVLLAACAAQARPRGACSTFVIVTTMELYTPEAVAANGGSVAAVEDKIRAAVSGFNSDLRASGIACVQLSLVRMEQHDFSVEGIDLLNALPSDAGVAALRDLYAADLVGVWDDGPWNLGSIGSADEPDPDDGFHVLSAEQPAGVPVSSHEIGHNFGLRHDDANFEWFGSGRGICRTEEPQFRDLMAVCQGVSPIPPLVRLFSNPDLLCYGVPCGDETRDAAAMIRIMAPIVAGYR